MASQSEITFGSRIFNAEKLSNNIDTFPAYNPVAPDVTPATYKTLIQTIKSNNALVATKSSDFSLAVDNRQLFFAKAPDSLSKLLSPISSYIRAKFGKTSKQYADIIALVTKIRGEKTSKLKKDEEGEFVSQSERSYGSQTQHFADIIAILTSYGTGYTPTNPKIDITALNDYLTILTDANNTVTAIYAPLKTAKDLRLEQYADLKDRSNRIKDGIKSQYGFKSTEYDIVKGYKI